MDTKHHDPLTKALQAVGLSPIQFAKDHFKRSYQAFRTGIRRGILKADEIHKICFYTGKTFEELFPNPYKKERKPITLNLAVMPVKSFDELISDVHKQPMQFVKTEKVKEHKPKQARPERLTPVEKISGEEKIIPSAEPPVPFKIDEGVFGDEGLPPTI